MEDRLSPAAPRAGLGPLVALGLILVITVAWWALALWPVAANPGWLARTREVCFGAGADGLPSAGGWLVLIGEPLGMVGLLVAVWGAELGGALRRLAGRWPGRLALGGVAVGLVAGAVAVTGLVREVRTSTQRFDPAGAGGLVAVEGAAPPLTLVGQGGDTVRLAAFRGRPVLVTFAFAHCQTICPTQVREVLAARRQAATARPASAPAALIVTVDPWRDTPSRLPAIAEGWALEGDEYALSGAVTSVTRTLADWQVRTERDTLTGEVGHPTRVFLVDPRGRLAAVAPAVAAQLVEALARM